MKISDEHKTLSARYIWRDVIRSLHTGFVPLLAYGVLFKVAATVAFTPLAAFLITTLISTTGHLSVTNTEIAAFLVSLPGVATLLVAAIAALVLMFAEQGGLMIIGFAAEQGHRVNALRALQFTLARLTRLLSLATVQVMIVLAWALPFIGAAALTHAVLLGGHDINYYLAERPPEFMTTLAIAAVLVLGFGSILSVLVVRWVAALPLCLFEGKTYRAALKSSKELVSGRFAPVAVIVLGWFCLVALVATGAATGFDGLSRLILAVLDRDPRVLIITAVALIAVLTMGAALMSFVGQAGYCLLSVQLYERLSEQRGESPKDRLSLLLNGMGMSSSRFFKWRWSMVWFVLLTFGVLMAGIAFALIEDLDLPQQVQVTAHRGSSRKAPENSLSAVRQAIEDGADFAEIDVQETRDGVVVVIHDTDLMRVTGLGRKIWEVTYDEIRALDAGSWFSPKFEGERIPTLQQVINLADGKIKLNIELKFNGHDQHLAERVVQIIQNNRFASRCVVTSLEYGALKQVKQLDDSLRIGHIVSVAIGDITRLEVDFLSLQTNLVTAELMAAAGKRGLGVHVWTVNDSGTLVAMINKGVENIITDEPGIMSARLRERAALSDTELILLAVGDRLRRQ
jgi:glycerophosphoryl diester phosphodiesterase